MSGAIPAVSKSRAVRIGLLPLAIAGAWLIAIGSQWGGEAVLLHHHTLIEHGPPLWIGVPLFLLGWQVMIAAMMLPASLPTIRVVEASTGRTALFLAAFAAVWTGFGMFAFGGDFVLHHIVDATPWLAAHPWLIEAGVLGMAGAYQLSPFKRRSLAACRHPVTLIDNSPRQAGALALGIAHGLDCLGSSWALMLLMFAEGFANLWWMAGLTAVMVYETTRRHGQAAATAVGLVLLGLSAATIVIGWSAAA
jgi:predicted metal-binding membrane protein